VPRSRTDRPPKSCAQNPTHTLSTIGLLVASSSSSSRASLPSVAAPPKKPGPISKTGLKFSVGPNTTSLMILSSTSRILRGMLLPGAPSHHYHVHPHSCIPLTYSLIPVCQTHCPRKRSLLHSRPNKCSPLLRACQVGRPPCCARTLCSCP
jgi:hypothetical protein